MVNPKLIGLIMKLIKIATIVISTIGLSACLPPTGQIFGDQNTKYLKNDVGIVSECPYGETPDWVLQIPESGSNYFWERSNLPKGTLYFICDGDKELLPKDCQGNSLTTPEIRRYWKKYNLPAGTTEFDCSSGVPKVANDS